METIFNVTLKVRIAKDTCDKDKFTKKFILDEMKNGNATIDKGSFSNFIVWKKNTNQIMAEVLETEII